MFSVRSSLVAAALVLAVGISVSLISAAPPASGPATAPAVVGSVSGKVVDKDGKPASGATVRSMAVPASAPASAPAGGRGARGGRGGRGPTATTDDKGAFTLTAVPVGQVNITAMFTAADGTRQTGTAGPVDVKENAETKLSADLKLADAPARGGRGPASAPASAPAGN